MKKVIYGVLTLAILIGSAFAVAAGPGPGGPGGPGAEGVLRRLLSLDLTAAQKHDVAVILKRHRAAFETGASAVRGGVDALRDTMRVTPGDEQLVRQASRKVSAAIEEMTVLRGKVEAEVLAVLTPEQRKQWAERDELPPPHVRERFHAGRELVNDWIDSHAGADN